MTLSSTSDPSSIFEDGKLKPGIYKIQNLHTQQYADINEGSRKTCGRFATNLENGRGLWEIKPLGAGYSVRRVEPGKPDQFCAPMEGISDGTPLSVAAYPVAWRIEVVDDIKHRGFEYVRFYWGITKSDWDLSPSFKDEAKLHIHVDDGSAAWRIWKLIPVKVDGMATSSQPPGALDAGPLPPYDENTTRQSSTRTQRLESEHDEFGTVVNEVTVVTTVTKSTVTTHKKYRVEDA